MRFNNVYQIILMINFKDKDILIFIINIYIHLLKDPNNNIPSFIKQIIHKCNKLFSNPININNRNLQRRSFDILFLTHYISNFNYVLSKDKL